MVKLKQQVLRGEIFMNRERRSKIIENLIDAGCDRMLAEHYADSRSKKEKNDILKYHRQHLLDDMHKCQKRIDCLDYLIYIEKDDK